MRVILNDRALCRTLTGVGHYILQLLEHAPAVEPGVRIDPFYFTYLTRRDWRGLAAKAEGERAAEAGGCHCSVSSGSARAVGEREVEDGGSAAHRLIAGATPHRLIAGATIPAGAIPSAHRRDAGATSPAAAAQPKDLGDSRVPWWARRVFQAGYRMLFNLKAGRYDVYHEPNHIPIRCGLPTVTTIHDLSVLLHPEWHPPDRVKWYEREFAAGVRQTRRFIAASEFTKRQMVEHAGIAAERIHVTYQAPRAMFRPRPANKEVSGPAAALMGDGGPLLPGLPRDGGFFLYVGTLEPRKNVAGLLDAYAGLPAALRRRFPLVLAGAWGWKQAALRERLAERSLAEDVLLPGYLADEALARLYAGCTALVWPTLYEGFGLPPLEAMACGAAVIVSDVTSLPEVVGEAGVLLDPRDAAAWTAAMRRMAEDDAFRASRRAAGLAQAGRFTWEAFVRGTVGAYRAALLD